MQPFPDAPDVRANACIASTVLASTAVTTPAIVTACEQIETVHDLEQHTGDWKRSAAATAKVDKLRMLPEVALAERGC